MLKYYSGPATGGNRQSPYYSHLLEKYFRIVLKRLDPSPKLHDIRHPLDGHQISGKPHVDFAIFMHLIDVVKGFGHFTVELGMDLF